MIYENTLYSNCSCILDRKIVRRLQSGEIKSASHVAWDFYGEVTYDHAASEWVEKIMRYKSHVGTHRNKSISQLIKSVNAQYGWD